MRTLLMITLLVMSFVGKSQNAHQDPTHNFTVQRLIILNQKGEMLMNREKHVWAPPSLVVEERQYIQESLDSLAATFGVEIRDIELRGQFSYKYDYHPYATMRNYYVAHYVSGTLRTPDVRDEVRWVPISDAILLNNVTSIREITEQIIKNPNTIWGASFMVSHVGDDHPGRIVEPFYPLFSR